MRYSYIIQYNLYLNMITDQFYLFFIIFIRESSENCHLSKRLSAREGLSVDLDGLIEIWRSWLRRLYNMFAFQLGSISRDFPF